MKTTVDIPDALFRRLRERAARENSTLRTLISAALRQFLGSGGGGRNKPFRLKDGSVGGKGVQPGIAEGQWEQVREVIYEGRGS